MGRTSRHLFTSESVTEGHPDKIADQISDGILDAIIADDPIARVACETLVTTGLAVVAGEITTNSTFDVQRIVPVHYPADSRVVTMQELARWVGRTPSTAGSLKY